MGRHGQLWYTGSHGAEQRTAVRAVAAAAQRALDTSYPPTPTAHLQRCTALTLSRSSSGAASLHTPQSSRRCIALARLECCAAEPGRRHGSARCVPAHAATSRHARPSAPISAHMPRPPPCSCLAHR